MREEGKKGVREEVVVDLGGELSTRRKKKKKGVKRAVVA